MEPSETDLHTLAGAYAMDAVADADRSRFERHLADCEACREEVRGLREATARLAMATAVQPRPELRDQTMRAAARTRQLPPAVDGDLAHVDGDMAQETGAGARKAAARRMTRSGVRVRGRLAGPLPRLALAVTAALLAVIIVLGTMMNGVQHQLDQDHLRSRAIAAVLTASDVTMLTAHVSTGGTATVVMSHRQRALVFTAYGLPPLPAARRYELWLMGPAGDRSAGMLPASHAGMVGPMVVSGLSAGDKVGLTVGPAGGSPGPTSPPILLLGLGPS